jgi:hypothetical protein
MSLAAQRILDCLNRMKVRATYGAVGAVLGKPAQSVTGVTERSCAAHECIDRDPASVIVMAIGIAGSIASLISVPPATRWYQEKTERAAAVRDAMTALEAALGEVGAIFGHWRFSTLLHAANACVKRAGLCSARNAYSWNLHRRRSGSAPCRS